MNTNALIALGFRRKDGESYDRTMFLCLEQVKISIQFNEYTHDWGISFNDGDIYDIRDVDEILDFVACYVRNKGEM
jgi:hypothetical protein